MRALLGKLSVSADFSMGFVSFHETDELVLKGMQFGVREQQSGFSKAFASVLHPEPFLRVSESEALNIPCDHQRLSRQRVVVQGSLSLDSVPFRFIFHEEQLICLRLQLALQVFVHFVDALDCTFAVLWLELLELQC